MVTKDIPGYIANRMSAALWREAIELVRSGVATVEDVDRAVRYGPGLRWAVMGPHLIYHLGGGEAGIAAHRPPDRHQGGHAPRPGHVDDLPRRYRRRAGARECEAEAGAQPGRAGGERDEALAAVVLALRAVEVELVTAGVFAAVSAGSFIFGLRPAPAFQWPLTGHQNRCRRPRGSRATRHSALRRFQTPARGRAIMAGFTAAPSWRSPGWVSCSHSLSSACSWRLPLAWFFIAVMVAIAFIDWELMIIPNVIVVPAVPIGLAAAIALDPQRWWIYLAACVGAALFLFILALIWPGGMGMAGHQAGPVHGGRARVDW